MRKIALAAALAAGLGSLGSQPLAAPTDVAGPNGESVMPIPDQNLSYRAAAALDGTIDCDGRGPRTYLTRRRVAAALDNQSRPKVSDIRWLERIAFTAKAEGRS